MAKAKFKVMGRLDEGRLQIGTVVIDRKTDLFMVRPNRRRRVYELPLGFVAAMVCKHVIRIEVAEARAAKRARKGR